MLNESQFSDVGWLILKRGACPLFFFDLRCMVFACVKVLISTRLCLLRRKRQCTAKVYLKALQSLVMLPTIYLIELTVLRKVLLLLITFSFLITSFAQNTSGSVKGILIDSTFHQPIIDANVSIIEEKDSTIKFFALSAVNGSFEIKNLDTGHYTLTASFQGLEAIKKTFTISIEKSIVDFGTLKMEKAYKNLGEVIVKDLVPIKVNGDTLSYKADAFKTKPNATVEDLLKKLPGVQVAKGGDVKAQGEQVQKIYVDGKEFFSDDPKVSTKNLTADMIDRVEVYNETSEQSKFNGIDDGSRAKAINLKLKKDKKSGLLGKASAGYGTENRYNANITANYFKGPSQISLIASKKNINNIDHSGSNMGQGSNREGNGITKTSSFGLNYRDAWSKNLYVAGSYSYNHSNANNVRKSYKQTFLSDSTLLSDRETIYNNINTSQRVNVNIAYTIDSLNSIIYTSYFNAQNSKNINSDSLVDMIAKKESSYRANDSRTINNSNGLGYNWNNNLLWRRKFNRTGRTLSLNLSNTLNENERNGYNVSKSRFYNRDGLVYRLRNTDYKIGTDNQTNGYGLKLSYTEPLSANKILEFNYSYNKSTNTSNRKTYNYNGITKVYDQLIDTLTNNFKNINEYNRVGANFKGGNKTYNYQLGFAVQQTLLRSIDLSKNINLQQNYINLFPAASLNYQIAKSKNVQFSYRGNNNQPSIIQLQNITDITNYPYIRRECNLNCVRFQFHFNPLNLIVRLYGEKLC